MNYIGYIRVSTREQAAGGISLQEQITSLYAWSRLAGHELLAVYEDRACSGKNLNRPGLHAALKTLKHGLPGEPDRAPTPVHGLVVAYLDRLSRSVLDVCRLVESYFSEGGYALAAAKESLDSTSPMGLAIIRILAVMAQWQRETINERIRDGLDEKRRAGKLIGSVPWGYRLSSDGETLLPSVAERRLMARVLQLRRDGASYLKICGELQADGRRNRKNSRKWHASSIRNILAAAENAMRERILVVMPDESIRVASDVATDEQLALASPEGTAARAGVPLIKSEPAPLSDEERELLAELAARAGLALAPAAASSSCKKEEVAP